MAHLSLSFTVHAGLPGFTCPRRSGSYAMPLWICCGLIGGHLEDVDANAFRRSSQASTSEKLDRPQMLTLNISWPGVAVKVCEKDGSEKLTFSPVMTVWLGHT